MRHIEDAEQIALMDWARFHPVGIEQGKIADWLIHIPNGGKRNIREAARLKRMGVQAGVSDLLLALPVGKSAGLWIELKAPKGRASDAQKAWLERMQRVGYQVALCKGSGAAIAAIKYYLAGGLVEHVG